MDGIMVVALNEHWQRVGDMAARTVVVDTRGRNALLLSAWGGKAQGKPSIASYN